MKHILSIILIAATLVFASCTTNPFANFTTTGKIDTSHTPTIVRQSPIGQVGSDLVAASEQAFSAFAEAKNGNVDYVWGLMQALNGYATVVKSQADVQALVAAWDGTKDQTLANRIASMFGASTGTIQERMLTLATAAQGAAASSSQP